MENFVFFLNDDLGDFDLDTENRLNLMHINFSNFDSILNEALCTRDDLKHLIDDFSSLNDSYFVMKLQRFELFYDTLITDLESYAKFFKISCSGSSDQVVQALDDIYLF